MLLQCNNERLAMALIGIISTFQAEMMISKALKQSWQRSKREEEACPTSDQVAWML